MDTLPTIQDSLTHYTRLARKNLALEEAPIVSYFGLWLLLATYGNDLTNEEDRRKLENHLNGDLETLQTVAKFLSEDNNTYLNAAVRAWGKMPLPHLKTELAGLPTQDELDLWARENTSNMIPRFPAEINREVVEALFATAVALKTGWVTGSVSKLSEDALQVHSGVQGLMNTDACGLVMVTAPVADKDIKVLSVRAHPQYKAEKVWQAMEEVVAQVLAGERPFEPEAKDGFGWTSQIETIQDTHSSWLVRSKIPAWKENASYDLSNAPGMKELAGDFELEALQEAVGDYNDEGFSAAAITYVSILRSMATPNIKTIPVYDFDFLAPHALTAFASNGSWTGIRLFDSWISPKK